MFDFGRDQIDSYKIYSAKKITCLIKIMTGLIKIKKTMTKTRK